MKKIINYEKDILFKTNIGELTSISLEHDFTVDGGVLRGDFIVSGEYKPNELSLNKEPFDYHLPLEYELDETIDLDTFSYDIEDFEYNVKDDCLTVYIDFGIRYDEKVVTPIVPEITEEDLNKNIDDLVDEMKDIRNGEVVPEDDVAVIDPEIEVDDEITEEIEEGDRLAPEETETIIDAVLDTDEFVTYHVHIVREGDSLESIAEKYGCTIELIKEYNEIESLEIKSKLIIPAITNE